MASLSHSESRRMYSWWWDSHISPKSSRWLLENLSDMDSKVKAMIKLIEVDADTFAKRAEMFYKKRPELMKLVEEFYRAYRALAEKYSSATGVLRQAHTTMVEVCPDHIPFELPDESPGKFLDTDDLHTPLPSQSRASFYPDHLQKNGLEFSSPHFHSVSSGAYTEEKQFMDSILGSNGSEEVRQGLVFDEAEEKDEASSESAVVAMKFEKDIQVLKDALAKLDAEKAADLANFQESLDRLSKLESEVFRAQEDSRRVDGQAKKAESEVEILRKALYKLEAEKNASFLHYQHSLERFSNLETVVSLAQAESKRVDEQAFKANGEVQKLKEALHKLEAQKEFSFVGYQWSLERLSKLESEFHHAQEDYRRVDERARNAEGEVETLKEALHQLEAEKEAHKAEAEAESLKEVRQILESEKDDIEKKLQIAEEDGRKHFARAVAAEEEVETLKRDLKKLTEEKEAAFLQYQQCLESISSLEEKLSIAQEEVQMLNAKLNNIEERRLVLEALGESQNQELTEKQKEIAKLQCSLDAEKHEHLSVTQRNEEQIGHLEECLNSMRRDIEEAQDKCSDYQLQLPVLRGHIDEYLRIIRKQEQKEEALVNEKLDLEKVVVDLRMELEEVQMIRHEREMQILKLSENNHSLSLENEGLNELFGARRSLKDGISYRDSRVKMLQERISSLEGENKSLKCQSAVCAQAVIALKESISSLEKSTRVQTQFQRTRDKGTKGEEASGRSSSESLKAKSPDQEGSDMVSDLKDLQQRLRAAEKAVVKIKKIAAKESIDANTKLEAAINLMEELKITRGPHPEESSENGSLMKDIVLDKVSETLSNRIRRTQSEETEYLLESWDTSLDRSIGLTVKGKKKSFSARVEGHSRFSSKVGSIEELNIDNSDISGTLSLPRQEANKKKILDRLNSDFQKLSNLRITVQDLTQRVDRNKKNKNHDEWDTLKDQLEEAEEEIQKLSDVQSRLKRSAEEKSAMAADESGGFRRRRIAEKAKKVSEKIGRLQLEVQKMQFVLLKLDDEAEKGKKLKSRIVESKKKVLLRDYLYGSSGRSIVIRKKKRAACCGFVQPSTRED